MLILAATPIGNLGDASRRLVETLERADVLAAEDTRVANRLYSALGIERRPRMVAVNEHTERERVDELIALAATRDVVVVTDAGMPTVSDPGYVLVREAAAAGVPVTAIPGASAVLTALAVSGLPTDRFAFDGFPPRKQAERQKWLAALATERRTTVLFESPHRTHDLLEDMVAVLGPDRRAVVCRELTKMFESVIRGTVAELAAWAAVGVRGEICVVLEGAPATTVPLPDALGQVLALVDTGTRLKDAAAEVAERTGLSKRELYEAALSSRRS